MDVFTSLVLPCHQ